MNELTCDDLLLLRLLNTPSLGVELRQPILRPQRGRIELRGTFQRRSGGIHIAVPEKQIRLEQLTVGTATSDANGRFHGGMRLPAQASRLCVELGSTIQVRLGWWIARGSGDFVDTITAILRAGGGTAALGPQPRSLARYLIGSHGTEFRV